jgi:hypothetical protein
MYARLLCALLCFLFAVGCAQQPQLTAEQEVADDVKCQSAGAKPGDPAYLQCRAELNSARATQVDLTPHLRGGGR